MKEDWQSYWDHFIDPDTFMRSPIEPFNNPVRVMIAKEAEIGHSVLDVGCASCISYPLFEGKKDYVGIDLTLQLLKSARKIHKDVTVMHGHAHNLPLRDSSFDTVFIKDVLEHIGPEAYKTVIAEMWRVAKHKVLIALFGGIHNPTAFKLGVQFEGHPEQGVYYFNRYGKKDLEDFIIQLPNLLNYNIIENVPLENSSLTPKDISSLKTSRTLIIINKKAN